MKEIITELLRDSVTAPSPDNFQPWRFEVRDNEILVYKVPARMNHLLDYDEHVLILTQGMLLENIVIAASRYGLDAEVQVFPDAGVHDLVAIVGLKPDVGIKTHPLYDVLKKRCSNRKPYRKEKIADSILNELGETVKEFDGIEMQFITGQDQIKKLGKAVSAIDQILCENKNLHAALFKHITWSIKEEQQTHQGLSLDSLELNGGEKMMFKAIKNWSVMNALNKLGFPGIIRAQNAARYGSAACSVIISIRNETRADYLNAGRFTERFWLRANDKGLSLHPVVGVIYCTQKVDHEGFSLFNSAHAKLLKSSYQVLDEIAASNGKTNKQVVFFFRMGYAKPTAYQSTRKEPEIEFLS